MDEIQYLLRVLHSGSNTFGVRAPNHGSENFVYWLSKIIFIEFTLLILFRCSLAKLEAEGDTSDVFIIIAST